MKPFESTKIPFPGALLVVLALFVNGGCSTSVGQPADDGSTHDLSNPSPLDSIIKPAADGFFHPDYGVLPMFDWIVEFSFPDWKADASLLFTSISTAPDWIEHKTYDGEDISWTPSGNEYHFTFSLTSADEWTFPSPFCGHLTATVNGQQYDEDFCY